MAAMMEYGAPFALWYLPKPTESWPFLVSAVDCVSCRVEGFLKYLRLGTPNHPKKSIILNHVSLETHCGLGISHFSETSYYVYIYEYIYIYIYVMYYIYIYISSLLIAKVCLLLVGHLAESVPPFGMGGEKVGQGWDQLLQTSRKSLGPTSCILYQE